MPPTASPPPRLKFTELMALERLGTGNEGDKKEEGGENDGKGKEQSKERFMSKNPAYNATKAAAYGGHVFAQGVWAASQTVGEGMVVHNVHGIWTLGGYCDRPFVYTITHLSEGRSYCTREVTVRQPTSTSPSIPFQSQEIGKGDEGLGKVCFVSIVGFKRDEIEGPSHQAENGYEERYSEVLKGRSPQSWAPLPKIDTPWFIRHLKEHPEHNNIPGIEVVKVDMSTYNTNKAPQDYRELFLYTSLGSIPPTNYNLHACLHLYESDCNGPFIISNANGTGDNVKAMSSLSHSVIFHGNAKDVVIEEGKWWCQESRTPRSGFGRGVVETRIWNGDKHVASTMQAGQVRWTDKKQEQTQKNIYMAMWKKEKGNL